jgi:ornithine cyclodeaminase/alanine dehydrogenase
VPSIERVVVSSRSRERAEAFAEANGTDVAESPSEAGGCDVVVTATSSKDPVLRGDWLADGALVCAIGANDPRARELDAQVIARATVVCCDSIEDARLESGDLIEPIAAGQLDWLEVQELAQIVSGELPGRQADTDVVVFKSNGIAPWDLAIGHEVVRRARERGVGTQLDG